MSEVTTTQTFELTVEEKTTALVNVVFDKVNQGLPHDAKLADTWATIARALANGKTIDDLCAEYNIPTTREVK